MGCGGSCYPTFRQGEARTCGQGDFRELATSTHKPFLPTEAEIAVCRTGLRGGSLGPFPQTPGARCVPSLWPGSSGWPSRQGKTWGGGSCPDLGGLVPRSQPTGQQRAGQGSPPQAQDSRPPLLPLQKIMHTRKRHQDMFQDLNRKLQHAEKDKEVLGPESKVWGHGGTWGQWDRAVGMGRGGAAKEESLGETASSRLPPIPSIHFFIHPTLWVPWIGWGPPGRVGSVWGRAAWGLQLPFPEGHPRP